MDEWLKRSVKKKFVLDISESLKNPHKKRKYAKTLFSEIAPKYFIVLKYMALFQDRKWKQYLVSILPEIKKPLIADVASGLGDIAFLLGEKYPDADIRGMDITEAMLNLARKKNRYGNVRFEYGDMAALPIEKGTLDIITGGYALRNAPDLKAFLQNAQACLKKGGYAAFLDFSKSPKAFQRFFHFAILKFWCALWSLILHRTTKIYTYIPASLEIFPDRKELGKLVEESGFSIMIRKLFLFGIIEVILLRKEHD